jgi:hypothetical protein
MMRKEIDILLRAASRNCLVVEKASHLRWTWEELAAARDSGRYQGQDQLLPPDGRAEVSNPYARCMQPGAARSPVSYRAVGQTGHFLIFIPASGANTAPGSGIAAD